MTPGSFFEDWTRSETPASPPAPLSEAPGLRSQSSDQPLASIPDIRNTWQETSYTCGPISPAIVIEDIDTGYHTWLEPSPGPEQGVAEELLYIPCGYVEPVDEYPPSQSGPPDLVTATIAGGRPSSKMVAPKGAGVAVAEDRPKSSSSKTVNNTKAAKMKKTKKGRKLVERPTQSSDRVNKRTAPKTKATSKKQIKPIRLRCELPDHMDRGDSVLELANRSVATLTLVEQSRRDKFLNELITGLTTYGKLTYAEARRRFGFPESEGTMRGRIWNLRHPELRNKRTPPWSLEDLFVLDAVVKRHTAVIGLHQRVKTSWIAVADEFAGMHARGDVAWPYCPKTCSQAWHERSGLKSSNLESVYEFHAEPSGKTT